MKNSFLRKIVDHHFELWMGSDVILKNIIFQFSSPLSYRASFECGKDSANVENSLKSSLLCNGYRKEMRPRKDNTQSVNVTVSYYVLTYEFEENDDLLHLGVWMEMEWTDEYLIWNSTQWSGIERLTINSDELWLPDFRHYSSYYNPDELTDCANPKCSVAMNGTVTCLPVCRMNAKCEADYSRWPFDMHQCNMFYGTWAHSMDEIDMHLVNVCLGKNAEFKSAKWGIVALGKGRSTLQTDKYVYPVLNVDVTLNRRASFEQVAVIGPILVIFLACSTVLSVVLLLLTLLNCWIRMRRNSASTSGSFFDRITGSFSQSRVAELLLAADYLELNYTVDVAQQEKDNYWARFGKLFDRALAIVCVLVYVVLVWLFIPFSHQRDELSGVKCLKSA
uniref:Neurotransmitter-gated ion-channel ligand-binding domain-containing protein n=1 Tax=Anopheles culicifacies TaxID=139723 RepID=A0A182MN91_9DIPT